MTATETAQQAHDRTDRTGRRRPFSTWMKKLTNFKGTSSGSDSCPSPTPKRNTYQMRSSSKKQSPSKNNNPYPESGHLNGNDTIPQNSNNRSYSTVPTGNSRSTSSLEHTRSERYSGDDFHPPATDNKSTAPTVSTDVAHSEVAPSHAPSSGHATSGTAGGGVSTRRGNDSTFSSPAPSVRSIATTLTTIHSAAPTAALGPHSSNGNNLHPIQFSHQFPTSPPPNALPAHLAPQGSGGHPATYSTATANNLLTDNASILTLASSSKRRRRRSMDTDASVRALAPSSLFGGSIESLPLSVLSSNIEANTVPHQPRSNVPGLNERASIYSAAGVAPALPSERNSYYAGKQSVAADGGSVKSGLLGHGRNDSISGSIGGGVIPGSPLASPRDPAGGKLSRGNSAWGEGGEGEKIEPHEIEAVEEHKDESVTTQL